MTRLPFVFTFIAVSIVVGAGCGDSKKNGGNDNTKELCADGPEVGGCGTDCSSDPFACASGFFCSAGECTIDCSISKNVQCDNGLVCTTDGRCVAQGSGGGDGGVNSAECGGSFDVIIRDFKDEHPDFQRTIEAEKGIVKTDLGADDKPVFNDCSPTAGGCITVEDEQSFDQWYRNVADVNRRLTHTIQMQRVGDGWVYDDDAYFPIDGQGWGNEGRAHNYHFTTELHASFTYEGGEVFTFTGDDDLFLFINGKLAIDVGGVHGAESATADMDELASELGIEVGNTYSFDLFHAERHTSESNLRFETSIRCFEQPNTAF